MSTQETSMKLLASSYAVSASRIREALNGSITIRNSRKPSDHPSRNGEVIGLCGQSGRHPYFRMPVDVLVDAINRIEQLQPAPWVRGSSSLRSTVDELSSICQNLRQRTYFDAGTGCVNDKVPAVVPLLPPEEIWCDGKELPLDIWRLISFEFDLVSSAIASQVPVTDIGQGVATQGALMLGYILNQLGNQRVRFDVRAGSVAPAILAELNCGTPIEVSAARLFFEAGSILTPLAPTDFTRWYAGVRYSHWLEKSSSQLRVRDDIGQPNIDSRYRGLFAEEMAIGLMAVILTDRLNVVRINNTVEVLSPSAYQSGQPIADFLAEGPDSMGQPRLIVAESKGSLGSRVSAARQRRAKEQIEQTAVSFPGVIDKVGLTFCSSIFFTTQTRGTHCHVEDPETEEGQAFVRREHAWRMAYSKTLRFAGLDVAARRVAHGEPAENLGAIARDERQEWRSDREKHLYRRRATCHERYGAEILLDLGTYSLMVDTLILNILRHGITEDLHEKMALHLHRRRHEWMEKSDGKTQSFMTGLGIGCVYHEELG